MPSFADQAASRRKFLQFLAGSPLLAAGGLEAFAGEGPTPGQAARPADVGADAHRQTSSRRPRRRSTSSTSSR